MYLGNGTFEHLQIAEMQRDNDLLKCKRDRKLRSAKRSLIAGMQRENVEVHSGNERDLFR